MTAFNVFKRNAGSPMAAAGYTSYRCKSRFGFTMIGAKNHEDAYREALRSDDGAKRDDLQIWRGHEYVNVVWPK